VPIEFGGKCPSLSRIHANYWVQRLAEEPKELFIRAVQEVESLIGEYPVIRPVVPVLTMLTDVSGRG
jgi:hypothetical protein